MMLTVVADSLNELLGGTFSRVMISEEEINEFVESKTNEIFSDWEGGTTKPLSKNSTTNYENDIHVFEDEDIPF